MTPWSQPFTFLFLLAMFLIANFKPSDVYLVQSGRSILFCLGLWLAFKADATPWTRKNNEPGSRYE